jgi:DnaJ-class molecular chaperone
MTIELLGADYHRNGIGGAGFYTALFTSTEEPGRTFFATMFVDYICPKCKGDGFRHYELLSEKTDVCSKCNGTGEVTPKYVATTAVLDVQEAAKGNIYMHEEYDSEGTLVSEGDNAWRGADYYSAELLPLIRASIEQSHKNFRLHYDLERQKEV